MNLLLVDDHAVVRSGVRDIVSVSETSACFAEASCAREALELLLDNDYDMVILDISLPGESGLQLLTKIRRLRPLLPVLVLSMYPEEGYALRSLKAGANGYLNKASVPAELIKAIRMILSGNTYASQHLTSELLRDMASPSANKHPHEQLSEREWHVLRHLAKGQKLRDIAVSMNVHPKTVSTYKSRIMKKLKMNNNAELLRYALTLGLSEY